MSHVIRTVAVVAVFAAVAAYAKEPRVYDPERRGMSQERLDRIGDVMQQYVDEGKIVGASGMVAREGDIVYFDAWGHADREKGTAMARDTIHRIYSMSKPITSVGLMMLYEENKFMLDEPLAKYLPQFAEMEVLEQKTEPELRRGPWTEDDRGEIEINPDDYELVPAERPILIRDLFRHTAGFTYGYFGNGIVDQMYRKKGILVEDRPLEEFVNVLAEIPLKHQPGSRWEYSVSVDVMGRLIEVLSGMPLDAYFEKRIFEPLGMEDTGFYVTEAKHGRFAQLYSPDENGGLVLPDSENINTYTEKPAQFSGGGGLVSTIDDYMRFCQMLLNGGEFNGVRLLSPKTIDLITADHLGLVQEQGLGNGYSFGLGFAVADDLAMMGFPGTEGEYNWGGAAGTRFWIDPEEEMIGIYMIQILPHNFTYGQEFKNLSYMAITE